MRHTLTLLILLTATFTINAQNLITNGNFEQGNTGFTTEYISDCPGSGVDNGAWTKDVPNDGQYCVSVPYDQIPFNIGGVLSGWQSCKDHSTTDNSGQIMYVNGDTTDNKKVWCSTINVNQNRTYKFSTFIASIHSSNPAKLQFSINGQLLGSPFQATSTPCDWNQFFELWESGTSTTAEICIVNKNTISLGNDFILDDIVFEEVSIKMPNVFTPGGTTNQKFTPIAFSNVDKYTLTIYNRWGRKVFSKSGTSSNDPTPEWDGKNNGSDCAAGVYYWVLDYTLGTGESGKTQSMNGFAHLIR